MPARWLILAYVLTKSVTGTALRGGEPGYPTSRRHKLTEPPIWGELLFRPVASRAEIQVRPARFQLVPDADRGDHAVVGDECDATDRGATRDPSHR